MYIEIYTYLCLARERRRGKRGGKKALSLVFSTFHGRTEMTRKKKENQLFSLGDWFPQRVFTWLMQCTKQIINVFCFASLGKWKYIHTHKHRRTEIDRLTNVKIYAHMHSIYLWTIWLFIAQTKREYSIYVYALIYCFLSVIYFYNLQLVVELIACNAAR